MRPKFLVEKGNPAQLLVEGKAVLVHEERPVILAMGGGIVVKQDVTTIDWDDITNKPDLAGGEIEDHLAAADPHPQYTTAAETSTLISTWSDTNLADIATTGSWTDLSDVPASFPPDLTAHLAAGDPHPQYLTPAEGSAAFASTAQGALAASALQPGAQIPWNDVTGKPGTFTPTAHTHPAAQISDSTTAGRTLLTAADATAQRTALGLGTAATTAVSAYATAAQGTLAGTALQAAAIGTTVQAQDAELQAIAGLVSAADRVPYFTGSGTAALAILTGFGRSLLDDVDAVAARTTLGLSTVATLLVGTTAGTVAEGNHSHSVFSTGAAGFVPASVTSNTTDFLRRDGTWATPAGGGGLSDGDKGDITVSGAGAAWAIDAGAVTLAKMADLSTARLIGRVSAGTGIAEALTGTQVRGLLNVADGATANASDAALRDRSTHTGTQAAGTISDFAEAVDDRVAALLVAGANVTISYNDGAGTLTVAATGGGTFVQAVAAMVWTVNHNLGRRPQVSVMTAGGLPILAEVAHPTANQFTVTFNTAQAGQAVYA